MNPTSRHRRSLEGSRASSRGHAAWSWLLLLAACGFGDLPPVGPENLCSDDDACGADRCDADEGRCVSTRNDAVEIVIEVVPPTDLSDVPLPSWSTEPEVVDGSLTRALRQPTYVDLVGTIRWGGRRVPAELVFTRPLDGRADSRLRVSTLSEPTLVGDEPVDFRARLGTGRVYDLEIRPTAAPRDEDGMPWSRVLPPIRVRNVETPMASPLNPTNYVWPIAIEYPSDLETPCQGERSRACTLEGTVVSLVSELEQNESGVQVQAIEVESGAVVSSTAVTGEDGEFSLTIAPDAERYVLRVTGGTGRPLFPTVTIDPALLSGAQVRVRVPSPRRVSYRATVESANGDSLSGAVLTFTSNDVFDVDSGLGGSFRTTAETNASGDVVVELLAGSYDVVVTPSQPNLAVASVSGLTIQPPPTGGVLQGQLFVAPERARVGGVVRTPSGAEVTDLNLEAVALGTRLEEQVSLFNRSAEAPLDDEGRFELRLDRGAYDLYLRPPPESGFPWVVVPDRAIGAVDTTLADRFDLEAPRRLDGEVTTPEGAPLANAEVRVHGRMPGTTRFVEIGRARTDETGAYLVWLPARLGR
ncbi:MAG: hypothetical protein R3B99_04970 [Polyangiales bacterium]